MGRTDSRQIKVAQPPISEGAKRAGEKHTKGAKKKRLLR